jgi:hypothetical protein
MTCRTMTIRGSHANRQFWRVFSTGTDVVDSIVYIFVTCDTERDIQAVLRNHSEAVKPEDALLPAKTNDVVRGDNKEAPLWAWFLPNPRP